MSKDTEKALEIIQPMAEELSIEVSADDRLLYCNGQAIGIAMNSTYATIMEFIGYVLIKEYSRWHRLNDNLIRDAKRFWISKELLKKIQGENE